MVGIIVGMYVFVMWLFQKCAPLPPQTVWIDLTPDITATGATISRTENVVPGVDCYYRVTLVVY